MPKPKFRTAPDALADFDAVAFSRAFDAWLEAGGRAALDRGIEPVRRDVRVLRRSLEVRPEMLSEAVTF
jgi:hypothetical protein